jgi:glycosyltransferase involved in cell wall biosynthesis
LGVEGEGIHRNTGKPPRDIKLGVISTPLIPTPPIDGYGGIELLVAELVKNLEELGFRARLYASPRSMKPSLGLSYGFSEDELAKKALQDRLDGLIDVVVDWSHFKRYSQLDSRVISQVFWTDYEGRNTVYPSKAVARAYGKPNGAVIYPGIDTSKYTSRSKEDWFIFFSRIIPEKGVEKAIAIARMANIRLKVVGHTGRFANQQYVEKIKSMCTGKIEWVGEVSEKEKIDLLSHARGLIFKPTWLESFGIFIVEALASGCPCIVSTDSGGPAEIVVHGETGYICSTVKEYCSAINRIEEIDSKKCIERAGYFSSGRMAVDWGKHILAFMEKLEGGKHG